MSKFLREILESHESRLNGVISLIKRGGTEGEKQAARAAYHRMTGSHYQEAPEPKVATRTAPSSAATSESSPKLHPYHEILKKHGFVKTPWNNHRYSFNEGMTEVYIHPNRKDLRVHLKKSMFDDAGSIFDTSKVKYEKYKVIRGENVKYSGFRPDRLDYELTKHMKS